ncbi:hypothetical protein [Streptomyces sp. NPDC047525]|uniref:hypothetical protein n=1 Tax=Streptomyces sp. NPDC047525 TaxID=3155264 RepID=UPI0033C1D9B3
MTAHPTVPLPEGMRVLTDAELGRVRAAAQDTAQHHTGPTAPLHIAFAVLAAAGLFDSPPPKLDPETCTALYLPHTAEAAALCGVWHQCEGEPGHQDDAHGSGEFAWHDADMGAVPAHPTDKE